MYLDYAELQAENHNAMTMQDWVEKLEAFLQFNGQEILHNAIKYSFNTFVAHILNCVAFLELTRYPTAIIIREVNI